MKSTRTTAATLSTMICFLTAPAASNAATWYVATTGNDSNPGTQAQPFGTIGHAIGVAATGDTVLLADGTYNEHGLDFGAKNLVLQSESGNPAACVLDCQQLANGIFIGGGQTFATVISGLTIRNAVDVGGPFDGSRSSSTMYVGNSSATITNCVFIDNNSSAANGVLLTAGGSATLTNCTFTTSAPEQDAGSALAVRGAGATVTNCTFSNNRHGALELTSGSSTVTGCTFTGNRRSGIRMNGGSATIVNCSFSGNSGTSGGGMLLNNGDLTMSQCAFSGNNGHNFGGGLGIYSGAAQVDRCTFFNNRVQTYGGAVAVSGATARLTNCLVVRNTSDFGWGCALNLSLNSGAHVTVINSTFAENWSGGQRSSSAMFFNEGCTLTVANSIAWDNHSTPNTTEFVTTNAGPTLVVWTNVRGGLAGYGNLDSDPLFVDAAAGNYRLQDASLCINAGAGFPNVPIPAIDFGGAPRTLGAAPDLGAYEAWRPSFGAWFVDAALGSDSSGNGSPNAPYATVTRAIDLASNGHTLYIMGGNYGADRPRITKTLRMFNWGAVGPVHVGRY